MKHWKALALLFVATVAAAVAFLLAGAILIPQEAVKVHYGESVRRLQGEGDYPRILDLADSGQLDNFTDALIAAESYYMNGEDWHTVFSNSLPIREIDMNAINMTEYVYQDSAAEEPAENHYFYSRYWMGFRTVFRFCLLFLNTYQAKQFFALLFYLLFAGVICSEASFLSTKHAMVFAASLILVRPGVISSSYQFLCCFLIALTGMLLVPEMRKRNWLDMFFLEIGMLTMFLDFYSTPLITFGLPYLYAYQLQRKEDASESYSVWHMLRSIAIWGIGYVGMWFAKMGLTTVFTAENGFSNGLGEFTFWMGQEGVSITQRLMLPFEALWKMATALCADKTGMLIYACIAAVAGACWLRHLKKAGAVKKPLREYVVPLAVALIPLIWIASSARPSYVHFWFQYRSLVVTLYGVGTAMLLAEPETNTMP